MKPFKCPGELEHDMRLRSPNIPGRPETDLSQGDIRGSIALSSGEIACRIEECDFGDIGDDCFVFTVCKIDEALPGPGESSNCQFAGECEFSASQDVLGVERRTIDCRVLGFTDEGFK